MPTMYLTGDELNIIRVALDAITPSGGGSHLNTMSRKLFPEPPPDPDAHTFAVVCAQISTYVEVCSAFEVTPHPEVKAFIEKQATNHDKRSH